MVTVSVITCPIKKCYPVSFGLDQECLLYFWFLVGLFVLFYWVSFVTVKPILSIPMLGRGKDRNSPTHS